MRSQAVRLGNRKALVADFAANHTPIEPPVVIGVLTQVIPAAMLIAGRHRR